MQPIDFLNQCSVENGFKRLFPEMPHWVNSILTGLILDATPLPDRWFDR